MIWQADGAPFSSALRREPDYSANLIGGRRPMPFHFSTPIQPGLPTDSGAGVRPRASSF